MSTHLKGSRLVEVSERSSGHYAGCGNKAFCSTTPLQDKAPERLWHIAWGRVNVGMLLSFKKKKKNKTERMQQLPATGTDGTGWYGLLVEGGVKLPTYHKKIGKM